MPTPRKKTAAKKKAPLKGRRRSRRRAAAAPRRRSPKPTATGPRPAAPSISSSSSRRPRPRRSTSISGRATACSPATATSATFDRARRRARTVAGIDIADGWKLRYVVDDGSKDEGRRGKRVARQDRSSTRSAARRAKANRVLLASDPDREGESIAWHIADELKLDPTIAPSASASTRSPRRR